MGAVPTFALPSTFLGLSSERAGAAITVAGIPFDLGTTNRPGARFGPEAIRGASRMLVDGDHPAFACDPASLGVCDIGNFEIALGDIPATLALIETQAAGINHLISLGGDHSITLPLLRALAPKHGPLGLIHFDAHLDTWPESFGQRFGHGSPFFHAIEGHLVDPQRMVQIGIRSPVQQDVVHWTRDQGVTIIAAESVHERGPAAIAADIRAVVGSGPTYLTFDIDALDPAFAPGTGTPEIGGLASWQAQSILRRLTGLNFVGMDVVEVAPAYDTAEITALAAATFAWEYLALLTRAAMPAPAR
ncbi:MAG: agmatinase [Defluviicoccus sp.]|nr:agmatinase [Defluviicoccus sp.]MDG4609631.1 agmatinase [Defluviicoccus sp.]